jgi:hypothetical protein
MTSTEYRKLIEYRVDFINKKLGTDYKADYVSHFGGWNMYLASTNKRGAIGFDCRKSNEEMLNYVDGIFELLCHYEITPKH